MPEISPDQQQEAKPVPAHRSLSEGGRSPYNVFGVAYDYYKEGWDNLWRKDREELKRQVEAQRGIIEKDGLRFKEMKFEKEGKGETERQLQSYVFKIQPLTPKERQFRGEMAQKKAKPSRSPTSIPRPKR